MKYLHFSLLSVYCLIPSTLNASELFLIGHMVQFFYTFDIKFMLFLGDLKKMMKKVAESKTDKERDENMDAIQELITLVQFANDECDYGEGLELGMDLFCYGDKSFRSMIEHLLPLAYQLLGRIEYEQIIKAHLKSRQKGTDLSQLD